MALLHDATVAPSKLELITGWLPGRPWFGQDPAGAGRVEKVSAYRLDDPAGEVGLESILVTGAGTTYQVPLSYRGAPLDGADAHLIGITEHSVLGRRWVYDACGDPVWASVLATTIRTGGDQAEQYFEVDGERRYREPAMTVHGTGTGTPTDRIEVAVVQTQDDTSTTVITGDGLDLVLVRRPGGDPGIDVDGELVLTGCWPGAEPTVLAVLR